MAVGEECRLSCLRAAGVLGPARNAHFPAPPAVLPGIDVNIKDSRGLTALDTVRDLPSQKSQQIAALIEGKGRCAVWGQDR